VKHLLLRIPFRVVMTCITMGLTASIAYAQESLAVNIDKQKAQLIESDQAVEVQVKVTCNQGSTILESLLYVVQDGNTSAFSSIPVVCDGMPHEYAVRVLAFPETPFHQGKAMASAYVLIDTPEGTSAGDTERIKIGK
jgi:hypothetical protein